MIAPVGVPALAGDIADIPVVDIRRSRARKLIAKRPSPDLPELGTKKMIGKSRNISHNLYRRAESCATSEEGEEMDAEEPPKCMLSIAPIMNKSAYESVPLRLSGASHISLDEKIWESFHTPDFNVLQIENHQVLRSLVFKALTEVVDSSVISVPHNSLWEYIRCVSANYRPNPFHNFQHAVSVFHFMFTMLRTTNMTSALSQTSTFTFLLSALTHDVGHPGRTNLFEINSCSELALMHNDVSVLENHHCSLAFRLMLKPGANILSHLTFDKKKELRSTMITLILATDMSRHAEIIDEAKTKPRLEMGSELEHSEQVFYGKLFLHSADLSGPAKQFEVARRWSRRVTAEFNKQVEIEKQLGLPTLAFMAAGDEEKFLQNEIGFSSFFVAPLWRIVSSLFPQLEFVHNQLEDNIVQYKRAAREIEKESSV